MAALELRATLPPSTPRQYPVAPVITINVPQRRPADDDAAMMHAWSIGTTRTAQAHAAQHEKAECPPEVYIG